VIASLALAAVAIGAMPASVDRDDQAAAEAAVAVFNDRLAEGGWSSTGPVEPTEPGDPAESEFGDCLGGFELYLDNSELRFDGETARAFSDNFEAPGADPSSESGLGDFGFAGAIVLVADDAGVAVLDSFVERLGDAGTVACIGALPGFASIPDEPAVTASITNLAELGVGEASARLDIGLSTSTDDGELTYSLTFAAARTGRSLAVIAVGGTGDAELPIDPVAELAVLVGSLG
jgi:hypothetical protein